MDQFAGFVDGQYASMVCERVDEYGGVFARFDDFV